eukprot:GDKJ01015111.1.p1 GENE.GDKJ01015111.1~~GDKJ01015111.1.p1  ORF type:complete len:576 (+),score=143.71 GDKJ01015111.1:29-1729(+)
MSTKTSSLKNKAAIASRKADEVPLSARERKMAYSVSTFFDPNMTDGASIYNKANQVKLVKLAKSKSKGQCDFVPSKLPRSNDQQAFDNVFKANPLAAEDNKFVLSPRGVSSGFQGGLGTKWNDKIHEHPLARRNHESQEYMVDPTMRKAYELSSSVVSPNERFINVTANKMELHSELMPSAKNVSTLDSSKLEYSHTDTKRRGRYAPAIGTAEPPADTNAPEMINGGASGRCFMPKKESALIARKQKDHFNEKVTSSRAAIDVILENQARGLTQTAIIRKLEGTDDYAGRRTATVNETSRGLKNLVGQSTSTLSKQWKAFDLASSPKNTITSNKNANANDKTFRPEIITDPSCIPMGAPMSPETLAEENYLNERRRTEKNFSTGFVGTNPSPPGRKVRGDAVDRLEIRPVTVSNWSPVAETLARQNKGHGLESPARSADYSKTVTGAVVSSQHASDLFDRVTPVQRDVAAVAAVARDVPYKVSRAIANNNAMTQNAEIERRKAERDFSDKNETLWQKSDNQRRHHGQPPNPPPEKNYFAGVPSRGSSDRPTSAREMMINQMKSNIF